VAAIAKQDVLDFAPELATVSDRAWDHTILPYANRLTADGIGGGEDGADLRLARVLLAAHMGAISKRGKTGAAGPMTSEAVGAARRSFGLVALAEADASLGATGYGQQLLGLIHWSLAAGPRLL
jgi:hypothetical protein